MGRVAFVFSGQGAQKAGMGKSFYDGNETVRALFDQCESLREGTLGMCFSGTDDELKSTDNTQPCLYLTDLGAAIALSEAGITPDGVAGFSLGEIPALAFAGTYNMQDGFCLATARGLAMAKSAQKNPASMLAVMKMESAKVEELCQSFERVYPVNYNAPGQLVVAGLSSQMEKFSKAVREAGGRCLPVAVGGGFHSPFMEDASKEFAEILESVLVEKPRIPVYSNYKVAPYGENVKEWMTNQINHPLRWQESIETMAKDGFDTFIEVGVGTTLKKLISRILPDSQVYAVSSMEDVELVKEAIGR